MGITVWHITFGTYGARLHGDPRLTVDRVHNEPNTPYLEPDPVRQAIARRALAHGAVRLTRAQRLFVEHTIPAICIRGGWQYEVCACAPDHTHSLLRADSTTHGKQVRRWLKRWLTDALNAEFGRRPGNAPWWAEGGSSRPVDDDRYLRTVIEYIGAQRAILPSGHSGPTRPGSL